MKDDLLRKLDELVEGLRGPDKAAEMTGRQGRLVSLPNSEADVPMEMLNVEEKNRFMSGEKVIFNKITM